MDLTIYLTDDTFPLPARGDEFFWGVSGPVVFLPTATNSVTGMNKWGSGPSIAVVWEQRVPWTVAFIANNVWTLQARLMAVTGPTACFSTRSYPRSHSATAGP